MGERRASLSNPATISPPDALSELNLADQTEYLRQQSIQRAVKTLSDFARSSSVGKGAPLSGAHSV